MTEPPHPPYLDCNTFIGRRAGDRPALTRSIDPTELVAELDRVGIDTALTYHVLAHESAPRTGNDALLCELAAAPPAARRRILPVAVVLPGHTDELPPPGQLIPSLLDAGFRMARIFPSSDMNGHRFSLAPWCAGDLLDSLAGARIPLAVDFTLFRRAEPPWRDLYELADNHPDLPVVLINIQGRNNRTLYPLLARFPNLHVQTAGFNVHQGLEDLCRRFGAHRLVFGSGFPVQSLGAARLQVDRALLGAEEKALIAGGNMTRLLDAVPTGAALSVDVEEVVARVG